MEKKEDRYMGNVLFRYLTHNNVNAIRRKVVWKLARK